MIEATGDLPGGPDPPGPRSPVDLASARGWRVCSFIGVGFPWPLRFLVYESSGDLVCVRVSSEERLVRQLEERARMEPEQEKEPLVLFLRRGDRRRRVKWSRKSAACLWMCSLDTLQSS